jgi:hypothetical protein
LTFPVDTGLEAVVSRCTQLWNSARWSSSLQREADSIIEHWRDGLDRSKLIAAYAFTAARLGDQTAFQSILEALDGDSTFGYWAAKKMKRPTSDPE